MKRKVTITTATELDKDLIEKIKSKFKLSSEDDVKYLTDKEIIGGIIIQIDDEITDASVRNQLNNLKSRLLSNE